MTSRYEFVSVVLFSFFTSYIYFILENSFRASDLALLYRCYPHLESTPQPQINTSFPNPFSGPQSPPVPPNSSKTPSRAEGNLNNAILCVRAGPSPDTPSVLCISAASGALYVRPLPDFVRWERTRIPSALSQLVNAPIQAVRGSIQHVSTVTLCFTPRHILTCNPLPTAPSWNKTTIEQNPTNFHLFILSSHFSPFFYLIPINQLSRLKPMLLKRQASWQRMRRCL